MARPGPSTYRSVLRRRMRFLEENSGGFHDKNEIEALRWALEQLAPVRATTDGEVSEHG